MPRLYERINWVPGSTTAHLKNVERRLSSRIRAHADRKAQLMAQLRQVEQSLQVDIRDLTEVMVILDERKNLTISNEERA